MLRAFLNGLLVLSLLVLGAYAQPVSGNWSHDQAPRSSADGSLEVTITTIGEQIRTATSDRSAVVDPSFLAEEVTEEKEERSLLQPVHKDDRCNAPFGAISGILGAQRSPLLCTVSLDQDAFRASAPPAYLCYRVFRI